MRAPRAAIDRTDRGNRERGNREGEPDWSAERTAGERERRTREATLYTIPFPEGSAAVSRLGFAIIEQAIQQANGGRLSLKAGPGEIDRNRAEAVRQEIQSLGARATIAEPDSRTGGGQVIISAN